MFKVRTYICGAPVLSLFKEVEPAAMPKGSHRDDHRFLQMPVSKYEIVSVQDFQGKAGGISLV
jgi:hypothetical protein